MISLGLIQGSAAERIADQSYKKYYMHRTSHWLGLDVHDVGDYKVGDAWRVLEPGMVLTVEPGLYIAPGSRQAPKEFRGIGIRIEDDVAISRGQPEVLTADLVKHPDEVERFMAGGAI